MAYGTLISVDELAPHLDDATWAVVDCRFALAEPELGRRQYLEAHIPHAVYAHLNDDLSGPVTRGVTGRHPLPPVDAMARTLSGWGIDDAVQVVAYDDAGGAYAARLWWTLRWLGHDRVAVLDGGWAAWRRQGRPQVAGAEARPARRFVPRPLSPRVATTADVMAAAAATRPRLLDARAADRYRGENETIDPVAGHIPGALSAPYAGNLGPDGCFLPRDALRARYASLLDADVAGDVICYCGSGVTAAHDALAIAHAGLGDARLYVGSWSEWITDPDRPIATGPHP